MPVLIRKCLLFAVRRWCLVAKLRSKMTFEQYWTILVKQYKLILICFLTVGVGTFIGSKLMTPMYQSSVLIQVDIRSSNSNNQSDYNSLLASDQLVQTEAALATNN